MKKRRATAILFLFAVGFGVYLFCFKTISNEEIWKYAWKNSAGGPGCSDTLLPGVSHIDGDTLYSVTVPLGRIVERKYRPISGDYRLEIILANGKSCAYVDKGRYPD